MYKPTPPAQVGESCLIKSNSLI